MTRFGDFAYRCVLTAFPSGFRKRYAADMVELLRRQRQAVQGRPLGAVTLWMRALADALRHGLALRFTRAWFHSRATVLVERVHRAVRKSVPRGPELRQTLRALRRSPWYALTVVTVLALSTALSATVFAIVDGVLFKPLPYRDAQNLYLASARREGRSGIVFKLDEVTAWRDAIPGLQLTAMQFSRTAGTFGDGRTYLAISVDERFFNVLGHGPLVGGFADEHFRPGGNAVAIISYRLWQHAFGGRRDAIGRVLPLVGAADHLGRPLAQPTIVGILPRDFVFPSFSKEVPDVIGPLVLPASASAGRNESAVWGLIRRPDGLAVSELQARLDAAVRAAQPATGTSELVLDGASLRALSELASPFTSSFRTLALVAGALTALSCLGVAGLSTARARLRTRDVVLRRALGATAWDLFRQSATDVAPPVFAGAAIGFAVAPAVLQSTLALLPLQTAFLKTPQIDPRVVAFTVALASATSLIVALGVVRTAWRSRLSDPGSTSATTRIRGFGRLIVAGQSGLAFALTLGGALVVTSLWHIWQVDPGFDAGSIAVVQVNARAGDTRTVAEDALLMNAELARLPGVTAAGVFGARLLQHGSFIATVRLHPEDTPVEMQQIPHGGDLAGVLGLVPVRGRLPTADELDHRDPVVVISERAAASLWSGEDAVGRMLFLAQRTVTVIGVVRDLQYSGLADRPRAAGQIYTPDLGYRQLSFLLRANRAPDGVAAAARAQLAAHRDRYDVLSAGTMVDALAGSISERRFAAWVYGGFAVCALVTTGIGILGLVAMVTSLRTREIAVRMALGAGSGRVVRTLLTEQMLAVAIGLAAGGLVAAWSVNVLSREVYGVTTTDPLVWTATAVMILVTATAGTLVPALRAARTDPIAALRTD
jgi:predicted permease